MSESRRSLGAMGRRCPRCGDFNTVETRVIDREKSTTTITKECGRCGQFYSSTQLPIIQEAPRNG